MTLQRRVAVLFGCVLLASPAAVVHARQIEDWPYEKLFKHAELVVIVRPVSVWEAKAEEGPQPPADDLAGVVTSFRVVHVVKGQYADKKLDLVHFRLNLKEGQGILNGPHLVTFHTKPIPFRGRYGQGETPPEYMLFLKKQNDGRFTFVSGQIDPELSVKQIQPPPP